MEQAAKPKAQQISLDTYRRLLDYDPLTGLFTWRERDLTSDFKREGFNDNDATLENIADKWNAANAGQPALTTRTNRGALHGVVLRVPVQAHTLAFAMHWDHWPVGQIDHYNGDKADNRISNLRDVDRRMAHMIRTMRAQEGTPVTWGVAPRELWGLQWEHSAYIATISQEGMGSEPVMAGSASTVGSQPAIAVDAPDTPTPTTHTVIPPTHTPVNPLARGLAGGTVCAPNTGDTHE